MSGMGDGVPAGRPVDGYTVDVAEWSWLCICRYYSGLDVSTSTQVMLMQAARLEDNGVVTLRYLYNFLYVGNRRR